MNGYNDVFICIQFILDSYVYIIICVTIMNISSPALKCLNFNLYL
ncbi:MAG: hypothetical protein Satyrvirus11_18 [Satyrvirus sp.]|uniref:Uncharacterized protein n=1 Tax=Satyrvirus sp. TaxID=2487771 RepID=A0A3G5ADP2_9VIRU|nr:MAG: hypothetical protein Satyrvirus11_18 [Satyrvirus sp.]